MEIRTIGHGEAALLSVFLYHAVFLPQGSAPPPFEIILREELAAYIDNFGKEGDGGVCAEIDGKPVGAAWARIIPAYGHIDGETPELAISVLPGYRSRGIGSAMLGALHGALRESGVRRISLSVQRENRAAGFYQRVGYQILEERGEGFIMVKNLL